MFVHKVGCTVSALTLCLAFSAISRGAGAAESPGAGPCAIHYPSDDRVEWECRRLNRGETLESVFGERWTEVARFNRIDRRHATPGVSLKVPKLIEQFSGFSPMALHHQEAEFEGRFIVIGLSEQFLGVYEYGALRFSLPVTTGERDNETPTGVFRITAAHREHQSTLYTIEDRDTPYPMTYALLFHVNKQGVAYWIHGRDMPGKPASHGCIGLYDEAMQKAHYGVPRAPELHDAKRLYDWVLAGRSDDGKLIRLDGGPILQIIGTAPGGRAAHSSPASSSPGTPGGCTRVE